MKCKKNRAESSWIKSAGHFVLLNEKELLKGCFWKHFC